MDQQIINSNSSRSASADRKTIEKNRRNHMKSLYSHLNSLLPHHKEVLVSSLPDQLGEATQYIKHLQIKLEKMREKKEGFMVVDHRHHDERANVVSSSGEAALMATFRPPTIDVCELGPVLKVVLITGLDQHQFMFNENIRIIHEEGAEVVNATYSIVDNEVFHTIHAKVGENSYGAAGAARISERLKMLIN